MIRFRGPGLYTVLAAPHPGFSLDSVHAAKSRIVTIEAS